MGEIFEQIALSGVDFGDIAEADFNAACDLALNTAIPGTNTANSANDVLLDQLAPRLPESGTLAVTTDLVGLTTFAQELSLIHI